MAEQVLNLCVGKTAKNGSLDDLDNGFANQSG